MSDPVRRVAAALNAVSGRCHREGAPAWPERSPPPLDPATELKRTLEVWRSLEIVERPPRALQGQLLDDAVRYAHAIAEEHEPDYPEELAAKVAEDFAETLDAARCWESFFAALECMRAASTIEPDGDGPPWFELPERLTTVYQQRPNSVQHTVDLLERLFEVWDEWRELDEPRVTGWLRQECSYDAVLGELEQQREGPGVIWYAAIVGAIGTLIDGDAPGLLEPSELALAVVRAIQSQLPPADPAPRETDEDGWAEAFYVGAELRDESRVIAIWSGYTDNPSREFRAGRPSPHTPRVLDSWVSTYAELYDDPNSAEATREALESLLYVVTPGRSAEHFKLALTIAERALNLVDSREDPSGGVPRAALAILERLRAGLEALDEGLLSTSPELLAATRELVATLQRELPALRDALRDAPR